MTLSATDASPTPATGPSVAANTNSAASTVHAAKPPVKKGAKTAAKPVAKPASKPAAKPTVKTVAKAAAKAPVAAPAVSMSKLVPAAKNAVASPAKPQPAKASSKAAPKNVAKVATKAVGKTVAPKVKPPKIKMVRDSFTFPQAEHERLVQMKKRLIALGTEVKKGELVRAGLGLLAALEPAALVKAVAGVDKMKTGRPKK